MKKINIGIIGLGIIGERLIKVMETHEKTNIVGVFDVDEDRMKAISKSFNLDVFSSAEDLIACDKIEAIYLAVPPKYHKNLALKIMAANKHLLCEKPLAGTIEEAKDMALAEKDYSKVTAMNFPMPYTAAYDKLKNVLKNKALGKVLRVQVSGVFPDWPRKWQVNPWIHTREEGGFVREVFTHLIQLIVDSFGDITNLHSQAQYPEDHNLSEIGVLGWGKLPSGIPVGFNGLTGVNEKEHLALTIYGELGTLEILNWRQLVMTTQETGRQIMDLKEKEASFEVVDAFYKNIEKKNADVVDFQKGYQVVKIVETLLNSK